MELAIIGGIFVSQIKHILVFVNFILDSCTITTVSYFLYDCCNFHSYEEMKNNVVSIFVVFLYKYMMVFFINVRSQLKVGEGGGGGVTTEKKVSATILNAYSTCMSLFPKGFNAYAGVRMP